MQLVTVAVASLAAREQRGEAYPHDRLTGRETPAFLTLPIQHPTRLVSTSLCSVRVGGQQLWTARRSECRQLSQNELVGELPPSLASSCDPPLHDPQPSTGSSWLTSSSPSLPPPIVAPHHLFFSPPYVPLPSATLAVGSHLPPFSPSDQPVSATAPCSPRLDPPHSLPPPAPSPLSRARPSCRRTERRGSQAASSPHTSAPKRCR